MPANSVGKASNPEMSGHSIRWVRAAALQVSAAALVAAALVAAALAGTLQVSAVRTTVPVTC
jgi:hypothetical protein